MTVGTTWRELRRALAGRTRRWHRREPHPPGSPALGGVAYLTTHYPALSHTFIEREVRGVRSAGVDVHTFSIRPTADRDLLSEENRAAAASTVCLFNLPRSHWLRAHLVFFRRPRQYLGVLGSALRLGNSLKARLWQFFYFLEAVVFHAEAKRLGVRHIHVHHANNVAEVARLACGLSSYRGSPWTWSLTMHGSAEFWNIERFNLGRKVESASLVTCISNFTRAQLMAIVGEEHWAKLHVVHMGVDLDRYQPAAAQRAERSADAPLRVLLVTRLIEAKGISLLLDAVRDAGRRGSPIELHIVGDGPMMPRLRRWVQDHGADDVHLLGALGQPDVIREYVWADVFCLPSFAEGVPVVLMEAIATELPVVTTQIAGIPELVTDGSVGGYLVPPGSTQALVEAFMRIDADRAAAIELGRSGRRRIESEFDAAHEARKVADLLRDHLLDLAR